ncbi:MAG: NAD(P)-dependent oxidoreductase [Cyanobacteria bacterium P01_A01_bin.105]
MADLLSTSSPQRIFITGASGCVGHYVVETLVEQTQHELFLLMRNPAKLKVDIHQRPGVHIVEGNLLAVEPLAELLATIDTAILIATCWGGADEIYKINVDATLRILELLDPARCQQVIYFSTESILDQQNQPLKEAGEIGTDYIRSKYLCHQKLGSTALAPRTTTVFPTLVFGGEDNKPYSHISAGLPEVAKWIKLARFLKADGSFHFIHAKDIATMVAHLVEQPPQAGDPRELVLGIPALTVNQALEQISDYFGERIWFRIPLSLGLADLIINTFNIQMAEWDRFCLDYRHFTHQTVLTPATFGQDTYCPTIADLFRVSGVAGK